LVKLVIPISNVLPERELLLTLDSRVEDARRFCGGWRRFELFVRLPVDPSQAAKSQRLRGAVKAGFTLLELLLVLAVLVTLAALSWPRMMRYVAENSLKQNVETVRRELAATRIRAIESGLTYQFRFEPMAQAFVILPFDRHEIVTDDEKSTAPPPAKTLVGHLSSDSQFDPAIDKTGETTGGQRLDEMWLALLKEGALYTDTIWSQPILFRPNGESQDARLVIRDKHGNTIELTVRGLTGGVRVERMRRPEVQP
jgi:prepilin-type N-terminal cleavage/methylation domain-containing protein